MKVIANCVCCGQPHNTLCDCGPCCVLPPILTAVLHDVEIDDGVTVTTLGDVTVVMQQGDPDSEATGGGCDAERMFDGEFGDLDDADEADISAAIVTSTVDGACVTKLRVTYWYLGLGVAMSPPGPVLEVDASAVACGSPAAAVGSYSATFPGDTSTEAGYTLTMSGATVVGDWPTVTPSVVPCDFAADVAVATMRFPTIFCASCCYSSGAIVGAAPGPLTGGIDFVGPPASGNVDCNGVGSITYASSDVGCDPITITTERVLRVWTTGTPPAVGSFIFQDLLVTITGGPCDGLQFVARLTYLF